MLDTVGLSVLTGRNKPNDSAYTQQRLPSWQPVLTPRTVIESFTFLGVLLLVMGGVLFSVNKGVVEIMVTYTDCRAEPPNSGTCADVVEDGGREGCRCRVAFTVSHDLEGPVYIYYSLDNYYQNYRRYVTSRSVKQLHGDGGTTNCGPLSKLNGKEIAPCGFIANSLFNDTIGLVDSRSHKIELSAEGIAWKIDRTHKFRNPPTWENTVKPPYWIHNVTDFKGDAGQGFTNQDLIVWMRTAALPSFRKLYRVVEGGLPSGNYNLIIGYNYPVTQFGGDKHVVLSTMSALGGHNNFLPISYISMGTLCLLLALAFTIRVLLVPRRLGDIRIAQWGRPRH